jgi:hypothetical protein
MAKPTGARQFATRADLRPPSIVVDKQSASTLGHGDIFVAPKNGRGQFGTMIADGTGQLIWFRPLPERTTAFGFRTQTYHGKRVLTWWQGQSPRGQGVGVGFIYDTSYRRIATVRAGNGFFADFHEFQLTPRNTALVVAYQPVKFGAGSGTDALVQEIDIRTGLVMFEWHSLGQIPSSESYASARRGSRTTSRT